MPYTSNLDSNQPKRRPGRPKGKNEKTRKHGRLPKSANGGSIRKGQKRANVNDLQKKASTSIITRAPLTTQSEVQAPNSPFAEHLNFNWATELLFVAPQLMQRPLLPNYQYGKHLHAAFLAQFHSFLVQALYSYAPASPLQVKFAFDGEYSVVAPDRHVVGRATVGPHVLSVKNIIACMTGLDFGFSNWVGLLTNADGIVTRFTCSPIVNVLQPLPTPTLIPQRMLGELEIIVLPNISHKYFPGEKTMVRFRLFG
ncbi:hypothetical protein B0H11DRAFT_1934486 [Mycena galericulata]|nr:hypothetical protein B0H11DRAFT_1934486 [Mycena galericulata]